MNNIRKETLYMALIKGAKEVMENRFLLNEINLFPVPDSDTGNNLYSLMQSIILNAELKHSVRATLESVADSAILGARGNSGLIFAEYFHGISQMTSDTSEITVREFALATQRGYLYANEAVAKPVEGTILTTMKVFHEAIDTLINEGHPFPEILERAYRCVEEAVLKTANQIRKNSVVDSGAMGFACFIKGFLNGIDAPLEGVEENMLEVMPTTSKGFHEHVDEKGMRYCTEALLEGEAIDIPSIKANLESYGNSLIVAGGKNKVRVHIHTNTPHLVFEFLEPSYTILTQKVDDMLWKQNVVHKRKYNTLIITDSIADIPHHVLGEEQVGVIHLNILLGRESYIDKLTITNEQLFRLTKKKRVQPTSSQPSAQVVGELFEEMLAYYEKIIVVTVSKALSGTYDVIKKAAKPFESQIEVIDSRQNSVAEGLIVWRAIKAIKDGMQSDKLRTLINRDVENSKILVSIKTLDNMIASGRLSTKMGSVAKRIGLKPIITLDSQGRGAVEKITFSSSDANLKIIRHMHQINQKRKIGSYAVAYVGDKAAGEKMAHELETTLGFSCEYIVESSSVIAAGAGEGAVAVAYTLK